MVDVNGFKGSRSRGAKGSRGTTTPLPAERVQPQTIEEVYRVTSCILHHTFDSPNGLTGKRVHN
jgi:hypothetical protein